MTDEEYNDSALITYLLLGRVASKVEDLIASLKEEGFEEQKIINSLLVHTTELKDLTK